MNGKLKEVKTKEKFQKSLQKLKSEPEKIKASIKKISRHKLMINNRAFMLPSLSFCKDKNIRNNQQALVFVANRPTSTTILTSMPIQTITSVCPLAPSPNSLSPKNLLRFASFSFVFRAIQKIKNGIQILKNYVNKKRSKQFEASASLKKSKKSKSPSILLKSAKVSKSSLSSSDKPNSLSFLDSSHPCSLCCDKSDFLVLPQNKSDKKVSLSNKIGNIISTTTNNNNITSGYVDHIMLKLPTSLTNSLSRSSTSSNSIGSSSLIVQTTPKKSLDFDRNNMGSIEKLRNINLLSSPPSYLSLTPSPDSTSFFPTSFFIPFVPTSNSSILSPLHPISLPTQPQVHSNLFPAQNRPILSQTSKDTNINLNDMMHKASELQQYRLTNVGISGDLKKLNETYEENFYRSNEMSHYLLARRQALSGNSDTESNSSDTESPDQMITTMSILKRQTSPSLVVAPTVTNQTEATNLSASKKTFFLGLTGQELLNQRNQLHNIKTKKQYFEQTNEPKMFLEMRKQFDKMKIKQLNSQPKAQGSPDSEDEWQD